MRTPLHSQTPPEATLLKGAFAQDSTLPRSGHLWRTPAERRGPAALRQWLLCQLLTQARLRQPSACPWNPVLTQHDRAPFRRNPACDLIFTRCWQRRDDGVSSKYPVCHCNCNPQLPTIGDIARALYKLILLAFRSGAGASSSRSSQDRLARASPSYATLTPRQGRSLLRR